MSSDQSSDSNPSMLNGHLKYVQGAVSSALGYETGSRTKDDALHEIRDAKAEQSDNSSSPSPPTKSTVLGTVEKTVGKITGCDGMVQEGQARMPHKIGIEEQSGTG